MSLRGYVCFALSMAPLAWLGCSSYGDDVTPAPGIEAGAPDTGTSTDSGVDASEIPHDAGSDASDAEPSTVCSTLDAAFCDDFDRGTWSSQWKLIGPAPVVVTKTDAPSAPGVLEFQSGGGPGLTSQLQRNESSLGKREWRLSAMIRVTGDTIAAPAMQARAFELQVSYLNEEQFPKSTVRVEIDTTKRRLSCFTEGVGRLADIPYVPGTWYPVQLRFEQLEETTLRGYCSLGVAESVFTANFQKILPESTAFIGLHTFENESPLAVQFDNVIWSSK